MYYPETDELRVRYIEGDVCNSINNRKFAAKIYYRYKKLVLRIHFVLIRIRIEMIFFAARIQIHVS